MSALNILVYEDETSVANLWKDAIEIACCRASVKTVGRSDFKELLKFIHGRQKEWRKPKNQFADINIAIEVDQVDVIVVDYDLLSYLDEADTTGRRLAYLLRCFTRCRFIIILNAYGRNVFDLSLGGPATDFADVHIGGEQIGNPGLWQTPFEGYRPWYWPVVPDAMENFEKCVKEVSTNLDEPVLRFLNLDCVIDWMPRQALDFLSGKDAVEEVTFRSFVESDTGGLALRDRKTLDPERNPEQIARVAAARIGALLNLIILPEQSVLVDAPHLVSRLPSILRQGRDNIDMWNRLCDPTEANIDTLLDDNVGHYRFREKAHWLWRPAWYWPTINREKDIKEVADPWTYREADWVFCEDLSRFVPIEVARDFRALVGPPFSKRFIFNHDAQDAQSVVEQVQKGGSQDPARVKYVPQVALSF